MTVFLLHIAEISLSMGVVICLALFFTRLFGKRFSAGCRYVLWTLIVLRLCIPFGALFLPQLIQLEIPLPPEMPMVTETVPPPETVMTEMEPYAPPMFSPRDIAPEVVDTPLSLPNVTPIQPAKPEKVEISTTQVVFLLWLAGALLFFGRGFLGSVLAVHRFDRQKQLCEEETVSLYRGICKRYGIRPRPRLYVCPAVDSPLLYGYFCPVILLPAQDFDREGLTGILSHELTHCKRGDLWIRLACLVAQSLYWFHPLVHLAAIQCEAEMELSCDERILTGLSEEERRQYGYTMMAIVRHSHHRRSILSTHALTTRFHPQKKAIRERLLNILDMSRKRRGRVVIALTAVCCLTAGLVIGCRLPEDTPLEKTDATMDDPLFSEPVYQVPDTVIVVDETSFMTVDTPVIEELVIGAGVEKMDFAYLSKFPALQRIAVDENNRHYRSMDIDFEGGSVVLALDGTEMLYIPDKKSNWLDLLAKGIDTPYPSDTPIRLHCCGAEMQVQFTREEDGFTCWQMDSIRYGDLSAVTVDRMPHMETPMSISGNLGFYVFRAGDILVVGTAYYQWMHAYVFTNRQVIEMNPDTSNAHVPAGADGLTLYPGENGQLRYRRTTHRMVAMQTVDWYIGFLTGPEQFWREDGIVQIADGTLHFSPETTYTVEDYIKNQYPSMEAWFDEMKERGIDFGFDTLEDVYTHSKSLLPTEQTVPVSDENAKNQLFDDWQHNLATVPCELLPQSADSIEELSSLGLSEQDSRLRYICAFVTGNVDTITELGLGKEDVYEEYKKLNVTRWMAWMDTGKHGEELVRFLFRLGEYQSETLTFPTETWLCYTVQEGILGTNLYDPDMYVYDYGAEPVNVLYQFLSNQVIYEIPTTDEMTDVERWHLTCYLLHRFPGTTPYENVMGMSLEEIQKYALLCFGIEDFTPGSGHQWDGVYTCLGHGGSSQCLSILDSGAITDTLWSIEVQYYAGPANTVRSHVYRYYMRLVDGEWVFDGWEAVEKAVFAPCGWSM